MVLEVGKEVLFVLGNVDFLKADEVGVVLHNLLENELLPIGPRQSPRRRIPVHTFCRIALAQGVVR